MSVIHAQRMCFVQQEQKSELNKGSFSIGFMTFEELRRVWLMSNKHPLKKKKKKRKNALKGPEIHIRGTFPYLLN